jgi:hypothetical protein
MSNTVLFIFGAIISIIWGIASIGPFLYLASKAEASWMKIKKEEREEKGRQ